MPGSGRRKTLAECTVAEIRALVVACTLIAVPLLVVSFLSRKPVWFLWPWRGICLVLLATLWYQAIRELRGRKKRTGHQ